MAWAPRYATVNDVRQRGVPVGAMPDDVVREALFEVSRWVEEHTEQIFYPLKADLYLSGRNSRLLYHPDLYPLVSVVADVTITEQVNRSRSGTSVSSTTIERTLTSDDFSRIIDGRYLEKHFGVWNEGTKNYYVTDGWWGWMRMVTETDFVLANQFTLGDDQLVLTSVVGIMRNDLITLSDETVLTVVSVDAATNTLLVEGGDLMQTASVAAASAAVRWGQVPVGIRDFVVEAVYSGSGVSGAGAAACAWMRRERTDTYEYEKHSPEDMGMVGGEFWTGNMMIDAGLARFRKPMYVEMI